MTPGKRSRLFTKFWHRKNAELIQGDPQNSTAETSARPEISLDRASLKKDLRQVGSQIQEMAQASELDFLSLGEALQTLWQSASEIAERGTQAAELMSGEEISDSIDRVNDILNRMDRYLAESSRRMEQNFTTFQALMDSIHQAERPLAGLHRIVTGLQTLGISTRIESALISQRHQNFVFLADEVSVQSEKIKTHSDNLLEKMQAVSGDIQKTLNHLKEMHETHQGSGGDILASLRESLSSLRENRNRASVATQGLSEQTDVLSQSMGQVVMSMQFHDITRQQIEHVKSSLDDLVEQDRDDVIGKGCELQAAQVRNSRDEISMAVEGLQRNLFAIAQSVREMLEDMASLSGMERNECASSYGGLEYEMTSAAARLTEYRQAEQSFSQTLESFVQILEGMKDFSHNIEMIGRSIKFVALNATIQAARIGREGAAMDVVAQGIRQLSAEAKDQTDSITQSLERIQEGANMLRDNAQLAAGEEKSGLGDLSEDINRVMTGVCQQNDTVIQVLHEMDETGRRLAGDTETLGRNITVHQTMNAQLDQAHEKIKRIGRLFNEAAEAQDMAPLDDSLTDLTSRYTMDSERRIHDTLLVPLPSEVTQDYDAGSAPPLAGTAAEDGLFDLFEDDDREKTVDTDAGWDDGMELFTDDVAADPGQDKTPGDAPQREDTGFSQNEQEETEEEEEDDLGDNVELF